MAPIRRMAYVLLLKYDLSLISQMHTKSEADSIEYLFSLNLYAIIAIIQYNPHERPQCLC